MFEKAIKQQFEQLDISNFNVDISHRLLFICGGQINVSADIPPSFRDRLYSYTACKDRALHDYFILAETFKDYFKENTYPDLLTFEDDIASISSLIIIFLESPGSLVELGIFCNRPEFYKKLLIIVSSQETYNEDSFIYLGPLQYIKSKAQSSVLTYPWPNSDDIKYDNDILEDLCENIKSKLDTMPKTEQFNPKISGHLVLLISEIISLCFPIQLGEIELALSCLGLKVSQKEVKRYLYLLQKTGIVDLLTYSSNKYFYPLLKNKKWVKFGKTKENNPMDNQKFLMNIRQSFVTLSDALSKRRYTALKQINLKISVGED